MKSAFLFLSLIAVFLLASTTLVAQDEEVKPVEEAEQAPARFKVIFELSNDGEVEIEVARKLAPLGVDHFYKLVKSGFYNECRFFRVVPDFVVQFGINGDPELQKKWKDAPIKDDPVLFSNRKGTICFATAGENTRTSQLFINLKDNMNLDGLGFAAFGRVNKGMKFVEAINAEYGQTPNQGFIQEQGNEYLKKEFPKMDYIKKAYVVEKKDK
tara:strand:- start:1376 stop:2014 length:639 start_codon:yes stop_codon:yes gene_type:complete